VSRRPLLYVATAIAALSSSSPAQQSAVRRDSAALSLEQAVARAVGESQEVRLARSQVDLARTQVGAARSGAFPQLDARLGYTRTFASAFSGGGGFTLPDSLKFEPDPTAPLEERVKYLEDRVPTAGLGGLGALFGNLPFGQANAYSATLVGSQVLYAGGRVGAALRIAEEFLASSQFTLQEQTAEIELQVRSAYFRARLAQELVGISQAAAEQATRFLNTERLRREAGTGSELDVLRAEVALANLQPPLVAAVNAAEVATLDLKRLVDLPLDQPLSLTTSLEVPATLAASDSIASLETLSRRASIAAEERQVRIREQQVRIARGGYLPSVNLQLNYGKQLFPSGIFQLNGDWRTDFTAGVSVSVPILNGGRVRAEVAQAQIALEQERLRLLQLREGVQVEYERARGERERARSTIVARERTADQARRVYDLTVLRYEQGLASQLEVTDARLALLQARTNLAQAVADFHIANATLARAVGSTTYIQP
jgi:outer membrane protein